MITTHATYDTSANRHVRRSRLGAVLTLLVAVALPVKTPATETPHSLGMAESDLPLATGLEAALTNPAQLGMTPPTERTGIDVRLIGFAARIGSNSWGLGEYRDYNGTDLTAEDKSELLGRIPDDGLRLDAAADAQTLALRRGRWAVFAAVLGRADGRLDRDVIDLIFHGNADRLDWEALSADGEALAAWKLTLAHGRQIAMLNGGPVYAGLSLSRVTGLYYARTTGTEIDLLTETSGLTGGASAELLTSSGGAGWQVDGGGAWQVNERVRVAATFDNLISTISWKQDNERRTYNLTFDDLTVDNFDDSLWVADEAAQPASSFSRGLPTVLRLGVGYDLERYSLAGTITQGFATRLNASTQPQFAFGGESRFVPWLPLRAGLRFGGGRRWAIGFGAGVRFGPMTISTGWMTDGALGMSAADGLAASAAIDISL